MLRWNLRSQRMSRQHNNRHIVCCQQKSKRCAFEQKKKSTNISPYPDEAIERGSTAFYPAILACWNGEEGQRDLLHGRRNKLISHKEKQEVPVRELPALTYRVWILQGASADFAPCFAFSPLIP